MPIDAQVVAGTFGTGHELMCENPLYRIKGLAEVTSAELQLWQDEAPAALVAISEPTQALVELAVLEKRAQRYSSTRSRPTPGGLTV